MFPAGAMYRNPSAASWKYNSPGPNPEVDPFHRSLPDYAVTPLIPLPGLAKELGLGHVLLKDESNRLGLPAFSRFWAHPGQCTKQWLRNVVYP
jgi:diaminopropionate ammonia-lyase